MRCTASMHAAIPSVAHAVCINTSCEWTCRRSFPPLTSLQQLLVEFWFHIWKKVFAFVQHLTKGHGTADGGCLGRNRDPCDRGGSVDSIRRCNKPTVSISSVPRPASGHSFCPTKRCGSEIVVPCWLGQRRSLTIDTPRTQAGQPNDPAPGR